MVWSRNFRFKYLDPMAGSRDHPCNWDFRPGAAADDPCHSLPEASTLS